MMKRWFHAAEKWTTPLAQADLRENGEWKLDMRTVDGRIYHCYGKYKTFERPTKLVFTFHPKAEDENYETVVTLRFRQLSANSTEMTLTEEGFRGEEDKKGNNHGWDECLRCLEMYSATKNN